MLILVLNLLFIEVISSVANIDCGINLFWKLALQSFCCCKEIRAFNNWLNNKPSCKGSIENAGYQLGYTPNCSFIKVTDEADKDNQ